jgi:hypothetical protein
MQLTSMYPPFYQVSIQYVYDRQIEKLFARNDFPHQTCPRLIFAHPLFYRGGLLAQKISSDHIQQML